ncbi:MULTISPECIES: hypothetical protein [unclassified Nocardiopsis]|uniref:hypothetical protein n=1 Tax=unclassified Nocardiopsis TaxID=2649073 RepID=UPI001F5BDF68|nr:hypothetical protein [Nocardiopsis sp. TSRI0078]
MQRFSDEEEAVRLANGVDQRLASEMPHGEFKHSGYGKDLSAYSLEDYTRVKHMRSALR